MDIHVLTLNKTSKIINCIFHIPIPSTLNQASISWQTAVVRDAGGADNIVSAIIGGSPAEDTLLKSGALIEVAAAVCFSSEDLTNAERLQEIKDRYAIVSSGVIEDKQIRLLFMGHEMGAT